MTIREAIKHSMQKHGVKNMELANAIGISNSHLYGFLSGRFGMKSSAIQQAATHLRIRFTFSGAEQEYDGIIEAIKAAMAHREMKSVALAEIAGVTTGTISAFLSDKYGIATDRLEEVFNQLEIRMVVD